MVVFLNDGGHVDMDATSSPMRADVKRLTSGDKQRGRKCVGALPLGVRQRLLVFPAAAVGARPVAEQHTGRLVHADCHGVLLHRLVVAA